MASKKQKEPTSFQPIVITSKKANDHFDKIKVRHSELVESIRNQADKIALHKQNKQMQAKEQAGQDAENMKSNREAEHKQRELDIKQAALM